MSIPFNKGYVSTIGGAALSDGRLQLWFTGTDHQLWSCWETTDPNNPWTGWSHFPASSAQALAAGPLSDGRVDWGQLLTRDAAQSKGSHSRFCQVSGVDPAKHDNSSILDDLYNAITVTIISLESSAGRSVSPQDA